MLLVSLGSPEESEAFFSARWAEARAVSDDQEELYEAFGLKQASVAQLFAPRVFLAGLKAARHGVGTPVGNPLRMSGWFLIDEGAVVWSHDAAVGPCNQPGRVDGIAGCAMLCCLRRLRSTTSP